MHKYPGVAGFPSATLGLSGLARSSGAVSCQGRYFSPVAAQGTENTVPQPVVTPQLVWLPPSDVVPHSVVPTASTPAMGS